MLDGETSQLLERIATALERLADHYAPTETTRERRPATLSTATYSREEREKQELRETLRAQGSSKRTSQAPRIDELAGRSLSEDSSTTETVWHFGPKGDGSSKR